MVLFAGCLGTVEPVVLVDSLYLLVRWWCEHKATFTTLRWVWLCNRITPTLTLPHHQAVINELICDSLFFLVFYLCDLQEPPGPWRPLSLHQWDYLLWTWSTRRRSAQWTSSSTAGQQHDVWREGERTCDASEHFFIHFLKWASKNITRDNRA